MSTAVEDDVDEQRLLKLETDLAHVRVSMGDRITVMIEDKGHR